MTNAAIVTNISTSAAPYRVNSRSHRESSKKSRDSKTPKSREMTSDRSN